MEVLTRRDVRPERISAYESHGADTLRVADGSGDAHAYVLNFEPGGVIGRHEAGYGQLFIVLAGTGWVAGDDGIRVDVGRGDIVLFHRGENHAKGSDEGMTAVMVQVRDLDAPPDN